MRNETILFAADNHQIDEEEGRNCFFDIELRVPKISNVRVIISTVDGLTVFIEHNTGDPGTIFCNTMIFVG